MKTEPGSESSITTTKMSNSGSMKSNSKKEEMVHLLVVETFSERRSKEGELYFTSKVVTKRTEEVKVFFSRRFYLIEEDSFIMASKCICSPISIRTTTGTKVC